MKGKLTKFLVDYAINRSYLKSGNSYSTALGVLDENFGDLPRKITEENNVKPYESIPGPKKLPFIGNGWRFAPVIGQYQIQELDKVMWSLYWDYGKMVRVSGLFGHPDLLFVFDGDIIKSIFKLEEELPHRPSMPSLHYYKQRLKKDFFGSSPGAVGVHGPLWDEFRRNVQQIVLQPSIARTYYGPLDEIATEFINRIDTYLLDEKDELPANFMSELNKWALESVARVSLDTRLGCLKPNLAKNSEQKKIINSILTFFKNVPEVELRFPIWRLYHNKNFRDYIAALETFRTLCVNHINEAIQKDVPGRTSIVKRIVERTGSPRLATVLALDFFLVGVDTTSITIASTMYHLSQNQEKQTKLYEELRNIIPNLNQPVNLSCDLSYLKACVKETLRLKPVVLGNGRSLQSERVIDGYLVPKGTHVIFPHLVVGNLEKYFSEPSKFIPERWLKENKDAEKFHPFVSLPFGYGRRACLGKRFAEAELYILLAKIFRKYKVEYNYGKMTYKVVPTYTPINPLKFKLTRRE
ncbi:probable cytochrome P450 49a1 isoform X1 [Onthophagus taurus]|uniref:probable cytochrome P450 49a1 isoform X1 n=1 Tax=Onthophagus taurus TaxID=166361 RepID=UPI0039BE897A